MNVRLVLDLKTKNLYNEEDETFHYEFSTWSFAESKQEKTFTLDGQLTISHKLLSEVIFEPEVETVKFSGEYDGEYVNYLDIDSDHEYNEKILINDLELYIDSQITKNPLSRKGNVKGEVKLYYDYYAAEFVFNSLKLFLVGEDNND